MYDCFAKRYAVVTGAAQGIGFAIAKKFADERIAGLALLDWNRDAVLSALEDIKADAACAAGCGKLLALHCDVSDYDMVADVMKKIKAEFGRIDILVNNAAITRDTMFHKMTREQWDSVINVNLHGVFNCAHNVINGMRDQEFGRIINISSASAYGNVGQSNYSAAKSALIGFTKTLAKESARKGITCNAIAPDFIDTDMMRAIPEQIMADNIRRSPMQRMGKADEIAAAALFLASDDASYVSGVCLDCSGAFRT